MFVPNSAKSMELEVIPLDKMENQIYFCPCLINVEKILCKHFIDFCMTHYLGKLSIPVWKGEMEKKKKEPSHALHLKAQMPLPNRIL